MENDLSNRLHLYANTTEARPSGDNSLYADALASAHAASAAVSAGIVCGHTRELRGDSEPGAIGGQFLFPGQDELEVLAAGHPAAGNSAQQMRLPLHPGHDTVDNLVLGAAGVAAIKSRNG